MTTTMTSRQRMLAAIHHEPVDRVPVAPWGLGKLTLDDPMGQELLRRADPWLQAPLGAPVLGEAALEIERREEGPREFLTLATPRGALHAEWTTTAQTRACTRYFCQSAADVEALLAIPYRPVAPDVAAFHALRTQVGEQALATVGVADGLCFVHEMLGSELACTLWMTEPTLVQRLTEMAAERVLAAVELACRGGVDCFRIVGGEYASQIMGPRAFTELVTPYDRELVATIHRHGAIAHFHNHGNMARYLELIADLGVDSLDPIEQPPYGDTAMAEAQRRIGARVCLVGGLDDMEVLETRPTAEVLALARELLASVSPVGYMLGGTSSSQFTERGARNILALVELVESTWR